MTSRVSQFYVQKENNNVCLFPLARIYTKEGWFGGLPTSLGLSGPLSCGPRLRPPTGRVVRLPVPVLAEGAAVPRDAAARARLVRLTAAVPAPLRQAKGR